MAPCLPTTPVRRSHRYVLHGTTSLFAALEAAVGQVNFAHHRPHRHQEFLRFLKARHRHFGARLDLHLICYNYATHKPTVQNWLIRLPRFHIHFIPTSFSWLNLIERWCAELTNRKLPPQRRRTRGRHPRLHRCMERASTAVHFD